jgi:hypothetical protein
VPAQDGVLELRDNRVVEAEYSFKEIPPFSEDVDVNVFLLSTTRESAFCSRASRPILPIPKKD